MTDAGLTKAFCGGNQGRGGGESYKLLRRKSKSMPMAHPLLSDVAAVVVWEQHIWAKGPAPIIKWIYAWSKQTCLIDGFCFSFASAAAAVLDGNRDRLGTLPNP